MLTTKFDEFIFEANDPHYLRWKRNNVTYRGTHEQPSDEYDVNGNGGMAILGSGLYTAALSNKAMARKYGTVYFVINGRPKNPKVFKTLNDWQIWEYNNLIVNYFNKKYGPGHENNTDLKRPFYNKTDLSTEMQKLGYDGILITGREMVNYTPKNVKYYKDESQVIGYYEMYIKGKFPGTGNNDIEL
jgi:hypothetical protein